MRLNSHLALCPPLRKKSGDGPALSPSDPPPTAGLSPDPFDALIEAWIERMDGTIENLRGLLGYE